MEVPTEQMAGVLRLKVGDRALVRPLDWRSLLPQRRPDTVVVALDLEGAVFISSLFLQGCVELARELAASGQQLVLLHMQDQQERLLELIEGAPRLPVLNDDAQMESRLRFLAAQLDADGRDEGVTRAEKLALLG